MQLRKWFMGKYWEATRLFFSNRYRNFERGEINEEINIIVGKFIGVQNFQRLVQYLHWNRGTNYDSVYELEEGIQ